MTNVIFLRWLAAPAFDQWSIWTCEMIGAFLSEKMQWKGFVKNKFFSKSNFTHTQPLALKWYFPIQDYLFIVSKPTHRHEPKTIKGRDLSITNRLDPSRVSVRLYNVTCDFCQPEHIEQKLLIDIHFTKSSSKILMMQNIQYTLCNVLVGDALTTL